MQKTIRDTSAKVPGADFSAILDALDEAATLSAAHDPHPRSKARSKRIAYRQQLTVSIEHPGGGIVKLQVGSRNLSQGGMGFLCSAFIHPGSACSINLLTPERESVPVQGKVVHCHLVRGRVHEVGVRFLRPISIGSFIAPESIPQGEVQPAELQGKVLLLEDSPVEQMLFKHSIQETKINLVCYRQSVPALEALKTEEFDIFVCDLYLDGDTDDGVAAINQARAAGFMGPIILMTAETSGDRHAEARTAGANQVMAKPYKPHALMAMLQRAHQDCGAMVSPELLVSTRSHQTNISGLMTAFHEEIGIRSVEIQKAMANNDMASLRRACLAIKAAATGVGYMNLAAAVDAVLATLISRSITAARAGLVRVSAACKALAKAESAHPS